MSGSWLDRAMRRIDWDPDTSTVTVDGEALHEPTPRDLRQVVSGHLYTHWHIGRPQDEEGARFYRDRPFEQLLAQATVPTSTLRAGVVVTQDEHAAVVELDGVRVTVEPERIVQRADAVVQVRVPASRPSLSPGFWLADGSRGRPPSGAGLVRVYLSIAEQADAPAVWNSVLTALEDSGVRYRAKIGSSARLYPRTDACVVYLGDEALGQFRRRDGADPVEIVARAATETGALAHNTSALTHPVAPGVAIAQEPVDPRAGMSGMSFGEHRCYAIATGVIRSSTRDEVPSQVARALAEAGIDPQDPAFNTETVQEDHPS